MGPGIDSGGPAPPKKKKKAPPEGGGVALRPSIFALNLKRIRERAGMTQTGLGEAIGIKQSSVSQLERGEYQYPSADVAHKMARALGVPIDEFWAPVDEPGPEAPETLREFLETPIGKRLTAEQRAELQRAGWVLRKPTVAAWQRLWDALEEGHES